MDILIGFQRIRGCVDKYDDLESIFLNMVD